MFLAKKQQIWKYENAVFLIKNDPEGLNIIRSDEFSSYQYFKLGVNGIYVLFGKKQNVRHLHSNLNILKDIDGIEIPAFGCSKARKRYPPDNSLSWSQYWITIQ